jgi:hypothetical protein
VRLELIAFVTIVGGALGCASAGAPPGGPEDHSPPQLVKVIPDSNAVNVREPYATFLFDETINDRGGGQQELRNYFLVSPSAGEPEVSWHRNHIDVRPRGGFRPNTAYTITLLPGLADLRSNATRTGASLVFSTGPTIPAGRITGTAFDWLAERPASRALLQAITPDSSTYLAQSDSTGHFTLGPLPPGSYLVRGIVDQNGNRALDRNEAFDTARVVVPQTVPLELLLVQRDTLPPRILTVAPSDSVTLRVTFDRNLDPLQPPAASAFQLVTPDSSVIPVTAVLTPRQEQKETLAKAQATADSLRRVDSLAGKVLPPHRPIVQTPKAGVVTPSVPPPFTAVLLRTGKPLAAATSYRLSVSSARGLSGRAQASERSFTTAKPAPPKADSTRASTTPAPPPGVSRRP